MNKILVALLSVKVGHYLVEHFEEGGHEVYSAPNIYKAISYLRQKPDVIITDIWTEAVGLSDEQVAESLSGVLTGWIWVRDEVLPVHPEYGGRIILYSADLEQLDRMKPPPDLSQVHKLAFSGDDGSSTEELIGLVATILNTPIGH